MRKSKPANKSGPMLLTSTLKHSLVFTRPQYVLRPGVNEVHEDWLGDMPEEHQRMFRAKLDRLFADGSLVKGARPAESAPAPAGDLPIRADLQTGALPEGREPPGDTAPPTPPASEPEQAP